MNADSGRSKGGLSSMSLFFSLYNQYVNLLSVLTPSTQWLQLWCNKHYPIQLQYRGALDISNRLSIKLLTLVPSSYKRFKRGLFVTFFGYGQNSYCLEMEVPYYSNFFWVGLWDGRCLRNGTHGSCWLREDTSQKIWAVLFHFQHSPNKLASVAALIS